MATGRVRSFDEERGFGFITDTDGRKIFFHYSYIWHDPQKVKVGDTVTYVEVPPEGNHLDPMAKNICVEGREIVEMSEIPPPRKRGMGARDQESLLVKFMGCALVGLTVDWDDGEDSPEQLAGMAYDVAKAAICKLNGERH